MLAVKTGWTITKRPIMDEIIVAVVSGSRQRVVRQEDEPSKTGLKLCLQGVVVVVRIVAVIRDVLSPAEATKERPSLSLRYSWSTHRLVGIVGRTIPSKNVSAFITNVTYLK